MIKAGCGDGKADKGHGKGQDRDTGSKHGQMGAFFSQYQLGFIDDDGVLIFWDRSIRFNAGWF